MKKKFFLKFFLFTVLATLVTFTSCKDYDDDISRLDNEITSLSGMKTDLETAKSGITAAKADAAAALTKANEALTAANAAGDPAGILAAQTAADAAQADVDAVKAKALLIEGRIEALEVDVAALAALDSPSKQDLENLDAEVRLVLADVQALAGKFNSMITEVSFDFAYDDYERYRFVEFDATSAKVDFTFAEGVTFVKGQRLETQGEKILVKVSPANADLSKMVDKISLIRGDRKTEVNDHIKAIKAERAYPLITRAAPTETGLWYVTFELSKTADLVALKDMVSGDGVELDYGVENPTNGDYLFAMAIENTVDGAVGADNRFVISDFVITFETDDVAPIYNLKFSAKNATDVAWKAHTGIKNRHNILDPVTSTNLTDKAWPLGGWTATAVPVIDATDARASNSVLNVEVGKEFNVKVTDSDVYAYYITLDSTFAVKTATELDDWKSYDIEGLNTVYKVDEEATLKINTVGAVGSEIGFRVLAVNQDGTLVDPDGKSFYVGVGANVTSTFEFTQKVTAPMAAGVAKETTIVDFALPTGITIDSEDFAMTIGHGVNLTFANIQRLQADGTTPATTWATTKKLQIIGVVPADLKEGETYTGTLTLKNAGIPLHISTVTLTKVLPTAVVGVGYKTNIHHDVSGQHVVYGYAKPDMSYDLETALNITPAMLPYLSVENVSTFASLPVWTGLTAAVATNDIGVPYLPAIAPGHGNIFDLKLVGNYGPVKYDATAGALPGAGVDLKLDWTGSPALKVEFRSFVQDLADWKYATSGTPVFKYGADVTGYSMTNITALPPAGARVDLTNTPALQDSRTFTVTGVKVLTGAAFDVVNEYFVPAINGTDFDFTAVITSVPASNVPTKLEVTLTDNFGHDYTYVLPQVFDMTPN